MAALSPCLVVWMEEDFLTIQEIVEFVEKNDRVYVGRIKWWKLLHRRLFPSTVISSSGLYFLIYFTFE